MLRSVLSSGVRAMPASPGRPSRSGHSAVPSFVKVWPDGADASLESWAVGSAQPGTQGVPRRNHDVVALGNLDAGTGRDLGGVERRTGGAGRIFEIHRADHRAHSEELAVARRLEV